MSTVRLVSFGDAANMASDDEKKQDTGKGFAGLSSMVSVGACGRLAGAQTLDCLAVRASVRLA